VKTVIITAVPRMRRTNDDIPPRSFVRRFFVASILPVV
jgi:hypothetical protein